MNACVTAGHTPAAAIARVGRLASNLSPAVSSEPCYTASDAAAAAAEHQADHAPWVNYVLAMTFCVQAVLIGTILSTAPLLLHDALGLGVLHVGFAFAGVCVGVEAVEGSHCERQL